MKQAILRLLALATIWSFLATGCYTRRVAVSEPVLAPTSEVIVTEPPPPPREEVIGRTPSTSQVWVPGYWSYQNRRWVWLPGHWATRPRTTTVWVPGHWEQTRRGWVWSPGHWE